jgi:hypothetical protein
MVFYKSPNPREMFATNNFASRPRQARRTATPLPIRHVHDLKVLERILIGIPMATSDTRVQVALVLNRAPESGPQPLAPLEQHRQKSSYPLRLRQPQVIRREGELAKTPRLLPLVLCLPYIRHRVDLPLYVPLDQQRTIRPSHFRCRTVVSLPLCLKSMVKVLVLACSHKSQLCLPQHQLCLHLSDRLGAKAFHRPPPQFHLRHPTPHLLSQQRQQTS